MATNAGRDAARARLEDLSVDYLETPGVDWGRMFGTMGLRIRGKVFAVAAHAGGLLIKVPEARADALDESGEASRMVMGGRPRREWVLVPDDADDETWAALLREAYTYVDSITPPSSSHS